MKFEVDGMDDFIQICVYTDKQLDRTIGRAVYPAAKYLANEVKQAINELDTDDTHSKGMRLGPTTAQKVGLQKSFGIARLRRKHNGYNVKLGFDGYNDVRTGKWADKGQPNAMIARTVNRGTSWMRSQPFMDRTVAREASTVIEILDKQFNEELAKLWK